jgi:hypothetical protein
VSHLQRSYPKQMVRHLGRTDMDLILLAAQGTQSHSHPLAQGDDAAELAILGNLSRAEPMDVDPPAPAHPPRMQESRSTSNAIRGPRRHEGRLATRTKSDDLEAATCPSDFSPPKPTTVSRTLLGKIPAPSPYSFMMKDPNSVQVTDNCRLPLGSSSRHFRETSNSRGCTPTKTQPLIR